MNVIWINQWREEHSGNYLKPQSRGLRHLNEEEMTGSQLLASVLMMVPPPCLVWELNTTQPSEVIPSLPLSVCCRESSRFISSQTWDLQLFPPTDIQHTLTMLLLKCLHAHTHIPTFYTHRVPLMSWWKRATPTERWLSFVSDDHCILLGHFLWLDSLGFGGRFMKKQL